MFAHSVYKVCINHTWYLCAFKQYVQCGHVSTTDGLCPLPPPAPKFDTALKDCWYWHMQHMVLLFHVQVELDKEDSEVS